MFKSILAAIVLLTATTTAAMADEQWGGVISFHGQIVVEGGVDQQTLEPTSKEASIQYTSRTPIYEGDELVGEQVIVSWN